MSTHCHIGVRARNGNILGCYVHYDGYPEVMLPALRRFLALRTPSCLMLLVRQGQMAGGMRYFQPPDWELFEDNEPVAYNGASFGDDVPYRYAVDMETGELIADEYDHNISKWTRMNT